MSKKDNVAAVPKYRFPEFALDASIDYVAGGVIFDPITNRNHHADLPILAITQEYGAIPRDEIDYKVSVTKKSLKAYKIVEKGDFIISLRSFQGGIEYSMYDGICSPAYIILRKKTNIIDQYYKYYFKSHRFIQDLNKDLEGIRDGKMISYGQFSSILLPKPDEEEQQKIADCLSSVDELISAEAKKLSLLNDYKKGWMQKLFPAEGKTVPEWRFPEFKDSVEWEENIMDDIVICNNSTISLNKIELKQSGYPVYGADGVVGNIDHFQQSEKYISMVKDGSGVGRLNLNTSHSSVLGTLSCLKSKNKTKYLLEWIYYYLNSIDFSVYVKGSGIPHIYYSDYKNRIISVPSLPEQQKIADFLSGIDELISRQKDKIEELKQHKKALMQGLFPVAEEVL